MRRTVAVALFGAAALLLLLLSGAQAACSEHDGCDKCTDKSGCVWCPRAKKCVNGGISGPSFSESTECGDWRWNQCSVPGVVPIALLFVLIVLVLLCMLVYVLRMMLCNKKKKIPYVGYTRYNDTTPTADRRRTEMADKYGRRGSGGALLDNQDL